MPKVYLIADDSPNAFATGRNPRHAAVAATAGRVPRFLNEAETEGVLAHVKHRDILISSVAANGGRRHHDGSPASRSSPPSSAASAAATGRARIP